MLIEFADEFPSQIRHLEASLDKASQKDQVLVAKFSGDHTYGVANGLAWLDREFRRAAGLVMADYRLSDVPERVQPIPPSRAGLRLIRGEPGSFDALLDFYGDLEQLAASHPLLLATLVAVAAGTKSLLVRMRRRHREAPLRDRIPDTTASDDDHFRRVNISSLSRHAPPVAAEGLEPERMAAADVKPKGPIRLCCCLIGVTKGYL